MKKQFLLFVGTVFTAATMFAQQVPNSSFETWSQPTNPDSWYTTDAVLVENGLPAAGISTQNTDATYVWSGNSSILLQTKSVTIGANSLNLAGLVDYFDAYTARPDSFSAAVAFQPAGTDTAFFAIKFTKLGVPVGGYPDTGATVAILTQAGTGFVRGKIKWYSIDAPDSIEVQFYNSFSTDPTYGLPIGTVGTKLYVDTFALYAFESVTTSNTVSVSVNPSTVTAGASSQFIATLSTPATSALSVGFTTGGTAVSGTDYTALTANSFDFAVGETADTITVATLAAGAGKNLTVTLTPSSDYAVGTDSATLTISPVSGIKETQAMSAIKLYPNPASSVLTVEVPSQVDAQNIAIVDITGRTVKTVNNVAGKTSVNVEGLANGSYVVSFTNATTNAFTGSKSLVKK